ncbi:DNA polymerase III subunit delta' [Candidatus Poribacteria bacterium]|nr:DNA polymerase III subunit delta' [Candidatus Poribacteria bacterium]
MVSVNFASIIGHGTQIELLRRTLRSQRVAGAYLFSGPAHLGKERVARAFAAALNCERQGDDTCGTCPSCRKVAEESHPDVRFVAPDGATFKIEQVRDIRHQIAFKPVEGRYKVYVLTDVEKMRPEGANALLKTLEEPPGSGVLILVTANLSALLPTIRSRSIIVKFHPAPVAELAAALAERGVADDRARELARLSQGRIGTALEWAESGKTGTDEEIPEALRRPDLIHAFRMAETWQKSPESLDSLLTWYRDLLVLRLGCSLELVVHRKHRSTLELLARQETPQSLGRKMKAIIRARGRLVRNINATLTMETLAFELIGGGHHPSAA